MSQVILPESGLPSTADENRIWGRVKLGAAPYLIHTLLNELDSFCLLITKDSQQAYAIESSLKFFNDKSIESDDILVFPDWETLPYDTFSPHEDIISQRLDTLNRLPHVKKGILIIPITTLLHRLPPTSFIQGNSLSLKVGQNFDTKSYKKSLESVGYRNVDTVYEHGEYTQRGAIFDIFPMGSSSPVRIELFDDEIESLRTFDPETQRSKNKLNELKILPAYEFPWDTQSRMTFRNQWLEQFPNATANSPLIRDIKDGIKPHGIEYYSPLFFNEMSSLFDYLPKDTLVLTPPETPELIDTLWTDINHRYEEHRYDLQRPILPPRNLFLKSDELFSSLKSFPRITLDPNTVETAAGKENLEIDTLQNISIDDRASDPVSRLKTNLDGFDGRTLILAESAGRREVLVDLFKQYSLKYQQVSDWSSFLSKDINMS